MATLSGSRRACAGTCGQRGSTVAAALQVVVLEKSVKVTLACPVGKAVVDHDQGDRFPAQYGECPGPRRRVADVVGLAKEEGHDFQNE